MRTSRFLGLPVLLIGLLAAAAARAGGSVELELLGDVNGAALAFQEWAAALGKAGIRNVRIRAVEESDRPNIETRGTADHPVYVVTGILLSRDEVALPGRRYRRSEIGRLKEWLDGLAEHGPNAEQEEKGAFGLTAAQVDRIRRDLAATVGFSTQGMNCRDAVEKIAKQLEFPLQLDADTAKSLADAKVEDEWTDLSRGTALGAMLRPFGYGFAPREANGQLSYAVARLASGGETWPIGSEPPKGPHDALPALFEFHNINIANVPVGRAIAAIGKNLKTPVLIDRRAIERYEIDLDKVKVSLPRGRTTYSLALRRILFAARLKYEVRCDEAGSPFVWITTLKPAP